MIVSGKNIRGGTVLDIRAGAGFTARIRETSVSMNNFYYTDYFYEKDLLFKLLYFYII